MKVLYVTGDLRDGDYVEHEVGRVASNIQLELSPDMRDSMVRLDSAGRYDLVLLESQIPNGDCLTLINHIRQQNLPVAILVIIGPADEDPPGILLRAGADDYIVRRPNFVSRLPGLLQQTVERHRGRIQRRARTLRVLYAGDLETARRGLAKAPFIELEAAGVSPDGSIQRAGMTQPPRPAWDAVVLEDQGLGAHVLKVLKEVLSRWPDCPVVLLLAAGQEDLAIQGLHLGAADCVIRTGDYYERLVLALDGVIARRDLAREKIALRSSEERLRMVVEFTPACVTLLAADATFLAMNWAGLSLIGAKHVDEVVGKNLGALVGPEQQEALRTFLERVCSGKRDTMRLGLNGLDNVLRELELRAVPLRRDNNGTTVALAVMQDVTRLRPYEELRQLQAANEHMKQSLEEAQRHARELEESSAAERNRRESDRRELEVRRQAAEDQVRTIEEALAGAEVKLAGIAAQQEEGSARWESAAREYEQRLRDAEAQRTQGEEARRVLEEQVAAVRTSAEAERSRLESRLQELEQQYRIGRDRHAVTEEELRSAGLKFADAEARYAAQQLELTSVSEQKHQLEAALRDMQTRYDAAVTELTAERSGGGPSRLLLEQRASAAEARWSELELALRQSEEQRLESLGHFEAEHATWESKIRELESLVQAAEARSAELGEQAGRAQSELARWQAEAEAAGQQRSVWEEEKAALAAQCLKLEADLKAAESHGIDLHEGYRRDRQLWESARSEMLNQMHALETGNADLREALRRVQQEAADFGHERSQWQEVRQSMEGRLSEAEGRVAAANAELESRQAASEAVRQVLEQGIGDLESEKRSLLEALAAEKAAREQLAEELRSSRTEFNLVRADLDGRLGEVLRKAAMAEESCRQAESRNADLAERFEAERTQWNSTRLQMEEERKSLEASSASLMGKLLEAERRCSDLAAMVEPLKTDLNSTRQKLESAQRSLEEERAELEARLQNAEAMQARTTEKHLSDMASWDILRQELEGWIRESAVRRTALEASLKSAESQIAEMNQSSDAERARWEMLRLELSGQLENARMMAAGLEEELRSAQSHCTELAERLKAEKERCEGERQTLADRCRAADERRVTLEQALREAEDSRIVLSERLQGKDQELASALRDVHVQRAEVERIRQHQRETAARYQELIRKWSESFEQALTNTIARCQQEEEEHVRLLASQHRAERDDLERQLTELRQEKQRLSETAVSERQVLESELGRWKDRHQALVSSAVVAYGLTDKEGRLLGCNDALARVLGYSSADEVPRDEIDAFRDLVSERCDLLSRLESEGILAEIEWSAQRADGRRILLSGSACRVPIPQNGEQTIEWFLTDISEKNFLEKELRQSRRVEAVGRLAAEVTPPLADLISSVEAQLAALLEAEPEPGVRSELLAQLKRSTSRARALAQQLRSFSQKQERKSETLDLNSELRRHEPALRQLAGEDIGLQMALGDGPYPITFVRQELEQALTSLVVIARDALPAGGMVSLETSRVEVQPGEEEPTAETPRGPFVVLTVSAAGCGAKAASSTVALDETVRNNAGSIRIITAQGSETSVRVQLPMAGADAFSY